ncbi:MAG: Trk system potassium transporter TrkA [Ostreibacterium sp.]
MKIIIGGAGDLGCHLAELLSRESHDITVIDPVKDKLDRLENQLDIMTYKGDVSSIVLQQETGIENADIFIAVSDRQNTNLIAGLIAKKLGAQKVIARVQNPEYLERKNAMMLHRSGIDVIISPEEQAANEIANLVEASILTETHTFGNRALHLFGVLLEEGAPIIGKSVAEVIADYDGKATFSPVCLIRTASGHSAIDQCLLLKDDDIFQVGDRVYFMALEKARDSIYHMSGKIQLYLSDIIILGGGPIGSKVAALLRKAKHRVKLIERSRERAEDLADNLLDVIVLEGDGRDADFLMEEGIGEVDAFIAVTGRSETNMVACLLAKSKGVTKNIALVNNTDYMRLSQAIGIDSFINKKLLTANAILKYVRKGKVLDVVNLYDLETGVMEFRVNENSKIVNCVLGELNFPVGAVIGGVIRNGKGYMPDKNFVIEAFDRVVIFSQTGCRQKVEGFF